MTFSLTSASLDLKVPNNGCGCGGAGGGDMMMMSMMTGALVMGF